MRSSWSMSPSVSSSRSPTARSEVSPDNAPSSVCTRATYGRAPISANSSSARRSSPGSVVGRPRARRAWAATRRTPRGRVRLRAYSHDASRVTHVHGPAIVPDDSPGTMSRRLGLGRVVTGRSVVRLRARRTDGLSLTRQDRDGSSDASRMWAGMHPRHASPVRARGGVPYAPTWPAIAARATTRMGGALPGMRSPIAAKATATSAGPSIALVAMGV